MNFNPMNRRLVVRPVEAVEKTKSGLYIPDAAKEKPVTGTVIAVANDCQTLTKKNVGLTVMYGKFAGTEIVLKEDEEDKKYILLGENEVLGYITE